MTLPREEIRRGWPAILACFCVAIHSWGFGFYGLSAYVARLTLEQGWPAALTSGATVGYYLFSAVLLVRAPAAVQRFGARTVLLGGAAGMSLGAILVGHATAPWHLFAGFVVLGGGWAFASVAAIAAVIAQWFDTRRGLAMSLALNGASVAGFTVAPALVWLADRWGLATATTWLALGTLALVVPVVLLGLRGTPPVPAAPLPGAAPERGEILVSQRAALASRRFWMVALPFTVAIMAQVGLVVHLVSVLLPPLGATGAGIGVGLVAVAAMAGRVALGPLLDRWNQRRLGAAGLLVQAAGLALIIALPAHKPALYIACVLFGLAVGNNITIPPLLLQRSFTRASFGLAVGLYSALAQVAYAFTPGLFGLLRDATGGYATVLATAIAMQLTAALLLLSHRPHPPP